MKRIVSMVIKEIREELAEYEDVLVYDNPSFDKSIIGITDNDIAVYDFDKMVKELAEDEGISTE